MERPRIIAASLLFAAATIAHAQTSSPPWSKGMNAPAASNSYVFHVPDIDNVPDLHGNPCDAKLVLFIGGNQFFVLPRLIAGFEKQHPELAGHIFYETLPPGILRKQMAAGNAITLGNLTLRIQPDVYEAGQRAVHEMETKGELDHTITYATNTLEIMVVAGNPKGITSLNDLAKSGLRLSMPNPETEGVARQIQDSLRKAGGDALVKAVYDEKVKDGSAFLTQIHHRQTPMRILDGRSDAGIVWSSEVKFQQKIGSKIAGVPIPDAQNVTAIYAAGLVRNAPHREAALAWLAYLKSNEARAAYAEFGFGFPQVPAAH